jgi:hypothetical protein
MPLADLQAYKTALETANVIGFHSNLSSNFGRDLRPNFAARRFPVTPAIPTTSVALDKNSDIALGPLPETSGQLCILGGQISGAVASTTVMIVDLLNHSGGLSAAATGEQTTGLPTAPLTRYTDGDGVAAALVLYATTGSTVTTVTVSYTNSLGVSGRISPAIPLGGSGGFGVLVSFIILPLQPGDTGVRSVESMTAAGSTGTAANMGIVLFRPLGMLAQTDGSRPQRIDAISSGGFVGALAPFSPDACLSLVSMQPATSAFGGTLIIGEV